MSTPETTTTHAERQEQADAAAIAKAVSTTARPPRASARSSALAFGWRGMLKVKHVPEQLLDVTITPVMFVLMFTYLFGGAIAGSTSEYRDFVIPGVLAMAVIFTTVYSGIAINTDLTKGVIDRFRSLPIWKPSPLVGALLGDCVRYLVAGTVIIVLGLILGFRPDNGVPGVLAALGLVILFSFSLSWVFTTMGLLMRSPNAVMNAGFMSLFPIVFLTNIYVDPETLPRGLKAFVEANPVTHLVDCTRGLMNGTLDTDNLIVVLATAFVLTAVFGPLTSRLYRTRA